MFYVYTLADPRDGAVFYVGKGKGARVHAHEVDAKKGVHSRKCNRIRAIWAAGQEVGRRIIGRFDDEGEAFQREIELIAEIGLENLTNVLPGGQGHIPLRVRNMSPKERRAHYLEIYLKTRLQTLAKKFPEGSQARFPRGQGPAELGDVFLRALRSLAANDRCEPWKSANPLPFRFGHIHFSGPNPLERVLELATDCSNPRGLRMDAVVAMGRYCKPVAV